MERPKPAMLAWGVLIGGVAAYDYACPIGETLSEGADRALERPIGRFAALGAIAITALHLCNALPERFDPIHQLVAFKHTEGSL